MNRQVLPSMVLSVLIVCFFAVVLFPLERDHAPTDASADPPVVSQTRASAPSEVATVENPAPPSHSAPTPEPEPPVPAADRRAREVLPERADVKSPEDARDPVVGSPPSAAPTASSTVPEPPAPLVPAAPTVPLHASDPTPVAPKPVVRESPTIDEADAPSPAAIAREPETTRKKAPETNSGGQSPSPEMVSIPRSDTEVTIVDSGETLDDVAVRIYGSRAGVETLLRANREVLTRRNGPLRTGLQLWTPER